MELATLPQIIRFLLGKAHHRHSSRRRLYRNIILKTISYLYIFSILRSHTQGICQFWDLLRFLTPLKYRGSICNGVPEETRNRVFSMFPGDSRWTYSPNDKITISIEISANFMKLILFDIVASVLEYVVSAFDQHTKQQHRDPLRGQNTTANRAN